MTLDDRITKDLTELYNNGALNGSISDAAGLKRVIKGGVSTKGLPGHFTGDRSAPTVFVTLNPGKDVAAANKNLKCEICKFNIDTSSPEKFISSYVASRIDFGNKTKGSAFDVKQARFLQAWPKDSGIDFPQNFPAERKSYPEAKKNVLLQKLQLELVPYCSKNFVVDQNAIAKLLPFIETLFTEIFSAERKYVIFAGNIFEQLFELYKSETNASYSICFLRHSNKEITFPSSSYTIQSNCCVCEISRNADGKTIRALIANTFPHSRLAGKGMSDYGKFCYDEYRKQMVTTIPHNQFKK
jgi:hypothetical protein